MSDQEFVFTIGDSTALNLNSGPELDVDVRVNVVPVSTTVVGIHDDIKQALLNCFQHVAWKGTDGSEYYSALEAALNEKKILNITAVYTQSGTVYDTDSLGSLKSDLVVTAYYDDGTTADVTSACTLSGTLTEGTSTITATYQEKSDTFSVTVTAHVIDGWLYRFDGNMLSRGTKDFGFTGTANYTTGYDGIGQAYHHITTDEDGVTEDAGGIKAVGIADPPTFGSDDFTISFWFKSITEVRGHMFQYGKYYSDGNAASDIFSSFTKVGNWNYTKYNISLKYPGIAIYYASGKLNLTFVNSTLTKSNCIALTPPSGFTTTAWHHYALTREGNTFRFFVDGNIIMTMVSSQSIYQTDQVCVGSLFDQTAQTATDLMNMSYSDIIDDLYVAESCKWNANFDPLTIEY